MDMQHFGAWLAYWRRRYGLRQKDLASKSGLSEVSIILYETGKQSPRLQSLQKILQAFDLTADEFFSGKEIRHEADKI